jgi:hypothetical protein
MLGLVRGLVERWRESSRRYEAMLDEEALDTFERKREAPDEPEFPPVADESELEA